MRSLRFGAGEGPCTPQIGEERALLDAAVSAWTFVLSRTGEAPCPPAGRVIYVGRMGDGAPSTSGGRGRMPRLLVITPDFPPAPGGIQRLVHRVASGLEGFETRVVALGGAGAEGFDATSGVWTRRVSGARRPGGARNVSLNAVSLREALRFRPQLTLSAHIVASPAAAAIASALGARTVQYFYAKEIGHKPRLAAFAARRAHASISISSYTSGLLAALGVAAEDLTLIPPGVDLPADRRPEPSGRPTLLTIARLQDRYKGHDVLMRSLGRIRERVPDVEWVVIGDGPLRAELEALAASLGLGGCVRFLGSVSDEQRNSWLRRADVLAMPSRLPEQGLAGEGFGIVYLEAGAYGKPVVAGNVGGALDAVGDGESGLLVDPTDERAVAEAVTTLLLDKALAQRMGAAGAERARRLAWPVIARRVQAVLLQALGGPVQDAHSRREPEGSTRTVA
jgi:phosphatidylinositol alpha-1,6-mannosyltransferase